MAIEFNLSQEGPLEFRPGLPADFKGPILAGAKAAFAKTNLVSIVVQEMADDHYSIRFSIARFLKRMTARDQMTTQGIYSIFNLKSNFRKQIEGIGRFHIREGQFICLSTRPTFCRVKFERDSEYQSLDIFYSPQLLEELMPFFPELKEVLDANPGKAITEKPWWIFPAIKEITRQILNCPFDENTSRFYFDLKVRELLFQILERTYKREIKEMSFTPWEVKKIHDARDILRTYISKKPPLIRFMARQVALNEFKLKAGFRQYFGAGIFEWLLESKMQHARELILTTNIPINKVCVLVGYPLTTNFITAFRKRFGVTPGSLRRK